MFFFFFAANAPHLSRVIPARSWAGAVPTLLTHEALDTLCRPCPHPQKDIPGPELSPLERFLGCVSMRRNLQRFIQSEETVNIPSIFQHKHEQIFNIHKIYIAANIHCVDGTGSGTIQSRFVAMPSIFESNTYAIIAHKSVTSAK